MDQESVDVLKTKHAKLENRLNEEIQRPSPDQAAMSAIKRQKLLLKDRIAELERPA